MKVLVTGANGKLAPHVIRDLLAHGHDVSMFARSVPSAEFSGLEWIQGDINAVTDCLNAVKGRGFDAIHHVAARPVPSDTPGSDRIDDPGFFPLTMQTNIIGLYNMLQAALRGDVGIFIQTGSNCALGHGFRISGRPFEIKYLPFDEDHPCDPEDSYSFSKYAGEKLLESYTKAYGMRCHAIRSAGIIDEPGRIRIAQDAAAGSEWSDWMFPWIASEDLASAHRLLMEKAAEIAPYGAYFCNNDDTTLLDPTMELLKRTRPELIALVRGELNGFDSLFSNRRLKEAVGWEPQKSWRQYLK